jgi:hypothetical protein
VFLNESLRKTNKKMDRLQYFSKDHTSFRLNLVGNPIQGEVS